MATICPYCNIEVSESAIEAEDGCCPECGSIISASSSFLGEEDISEYDEGVDEGEFFDDIDEEEDDIFERGEFDEDTFDDELDEEFEEEFDEDEEEF